MNQSGSYGDWYCYGRVATAFSVLLITNRFLSFKGRMRLIIMPYG